jgi:hypothetical protein
MPMLKNLKNILSEIFFEYSNYEINQLIEEVTNESKTSRDKRQIARELFQVIKNEMIKKDSFYFNFNPAVDLKVIISNMQQKVLPKFSPEKKTILVNVYPEMSKQHDEKKIAEILDFYEGVLIHEFIHFLDYEYISNKPYENGYKSLKPDTDEYYKNEMESEAFFHSIAQAFDKVNDQNKDLSDFYNKFGDDLQAFRKVFWNMAEQILTSKGFDKYRHFKDNKWEKKIYKLYFELKSKFDKDAEKLLEKIL